jgi:release factor glutamine methyltransferase
MESTIQYIRQELENFYPKTEIKAFERIILEHVCGLNYTDQVLFRKQKPDDWFRKPISKIIERLKAYEPIQYILGETEFCGLTLKVNPSVLIPRPETEELVHWITETELPEETILLDIGTGSGCIALALKKLIPQAKVLALDVSEDALTTARENAETNGLNVEYFRADILSRENFKWITCDVIVSNPPYVRESEMKHMFPNVLKYEPRQALFVPDADPLLFYRRIAAFAQKHLHEEGWLFFEINEVLGNEILYLLESKAFRNIEMKKDLFGKNRMIRCQR